jgi:hypothetical protein
MWSLIFLYKVVSVLLVIIDLTMLLLMIASKLSRGRLLQYGERGSKNFDDQRYYWFIYYGALAMVILSFISSVIAVTLMIERKLEPKSVYNKIGVAGLMVSIIYLLLDPFGLSAYY